MRAFAAVFAREVAERRLVFAVALLAGFLSIFVSLVIGWSKPGAADVRLLAAAVVAAIFLLVFGVAFGGNVIAGTAAEKRLSFFYARPIPAWAIWAGKLSAALALTVGAAVLAVLPGYVAGGGFGRSTLAPAVGTGSVAAIYLVGAILAILGSHAAVTVARLRSPWIGVDALFAGVGITAVFFLGRSLARNEALPETGVFWSVPVLSLLAAVLVALLAASAAQVVEGRSDARRAHGAFSATLWAILGAALLGLALFTWWVASATARELERVEGTVAASRGAWVETGGTFRAGRGSGSFLFDPATGRSVRIHAFWAAFSPDGTRAAWGEPRFGFFGRKDDRADLHVADLSTGRAVDTGLEASGWWSPATFSTSGRRLALQDGPTLTAYDVSDPANPKQIGAFRILGDGRRFAFVDEDTIRLFPRFMNAGRRKDLAPAALEIAEVSLSSKKSLVTGRLDGETLPWLRLTADGRYFLGSRRAADDAQGPTTVTLHDGRTGALVATLAEGLRVPQARLLTGNRLAVVGIADAKARALFFEGEKGWGAPARVVELGSARRVEIGGEIAPGRVAVSLLPSEETLSAKSARGTKLVSVDAATGAVSALGEGLVPVNRFGWWLDPVMTPAEAGAPWTSLFLDAEGRLVRLDAATGARTVLLGKGK